MRQSRHVGKTLARSAERRADRRARPDAAGRLHPAAFRRRLRYLPLLLRTLNKISQIVREEMVAAGAEELLMPALQTKELWEESGRWERYTAVDGIMFAFKDRRGGTVCLGPTHEEVVTDILRREIKSYKDLPKCVFQIQTKFRDEIRPRFGLMRAREFIMKDAYSFDADEAGLEASYEAMRQAYHRICQRIGFKYRAVEADSGRHRRQRQPGVHGPGRHRRGHDPLLRPVRLRGQPGAGPVAPRRVPAGHRARSPWKPSSAKA